MNCANHPDVTATAFCRTCGKALCAACQRPAQGTVFCEEHLTVSQGTYAPPPPPPYNAPYDAAPYDPGARQYPPPPPGASPYTYGPSPYGAGTPSPGLAFLLGLIPGVGAIYNGQYAKGLIHAIILGMLISIMGSGAAGGLEPLIGIMTGLWFFYMAFEAYHTAARRLRGEPVDEFSSIFPVSRQHAGRGFPVGPVLLIFVGIVFLLNTLDVVRLYDILRFWPVFLIALGAWMLYLHVTDRTDTAAVGPEETVRE